LTWFFQGKGSTSRNQYQKASQKNEHFSSLQYPEQDAQQDNTQGQGHNSAKAILLHAQHKQKKGGNNGKNFV